MKTVVAILVALSSTTVAPALDAGDRFFQSHRERTRRSIPSYDYRAGKPSAVSAVVSEPAVIFSSTTSAPANPGAASQVVEVGRAFVFNDLTAGPLVLTSLGAKADTSGNILVTGVLIHTGGGAKQFLGGKAVIRIEPLTSTGTTVQNPTVLACREASCWVRRDEPETVQICVHKEGFGDVERVRVFLEYRSVR